MIWTTENTLVAIGYVVLIGSLFWLVASLQRTAARQKQVEVVRERLSSAPLLFRKRLDELEAREGTYAPKTREQYVAMIRDQTELAQLRRYLKEPWP